MRSYITLILFLPFIAAAQEPATGPVFTEFGKVYDVEEPSFSTDLEGTFKVVFDVLDSPGKGDGINRQLETVARFLNMHVRAGKDRSSLQVALVVHGAAATDLLKPGAYQERFGKSNPNTELIEALLREDVAVILCGQSANHRNIQPASLIPGVKLSLSAMTALVQLQNDGYQLIKF